MIMQQLITRLHAGEYACVIAHAGEVRTFTRRGVADLFQLYTHEPAFLQGAFAADKVIGRAAAFLLVAGGVREVYADVLGTSARCLLEKAGIIVTCAREVQVILNRTGNAPCPLETLCAGATTVQEALPLITCFIRERMRAVSCPDHDK